ncbi:SpoIIAA family protein [Pseudogulbenkiania subflava]|uniref:SpoIIAA-like n=1 Tax=Pseudogulbenkiania subflava DSM 22618 TaxID=1123014 RepID=A0A1Y6BTN1_9NEIS|nr:STAS/SEC14 domain-containing protein [Pseudogulbenkiania subflava]SMF28278.1 SpoIIAA-like [Pseudogulbenkiania subflava DSM 22618]
MIDTLTSPSSRVVAIKLRGTLHDADYRTLEPLVEAALRGGGRARFYAQFDDFHGWDLHAAWDDMVFGTRHYTDFERIAVVGDEKWQEWMVKLVRPFTLASVRYFPREETPAAWAWIHEEL